METKENVERTTKKFFKGLKIVIELLILANSGEIQLCDSKVFHVFRYFLIFLFAIGTRSMLFVLRNGPLSTILRRPSFSRTF